MDEGHGESIRENLEQIDENLRSIERTQAFARGFIAGSTLTFIVAVGILLLTGAL